MSTSNDDDLRVDHLSIPKGWIVAVIGALVTAAGSAGGAVYKYGTLAGEFEILKQDCARANASHPIAQKSPDAEPTEPR